MRLIDADATELAVVKATTYGDALRAVREQPSIDIVRCKECKHRHTVDCFRAYLEYDIQEWIVDSGEDNDFCSYGEREAE